MKLRLFAMREFLQRYRQAFSSAWAVRASLEPLQRTHNELAFQPAVLELTDSPVSAAPKVAMRLVMALLLIALLWAAVGKLDIVAAAPGRVLPDSRTKTIQAIETSIVRAILVTDGQPVKQGQSLIELDAVGVRSDRDKARAAIAAAQLRADRDAAQVAAMSRGNLADFLGPEGATNSELAEARRLARSEFDTYMAKVDGLRSTIRQRQAEKHTTEEAIGSLQDYAKIASDRVEDYRRLLGKQYVSRQEYLMREQERISAERDLVAQRNKVGELSAAIEVATNELNASVNDTRRAWLEDEKQSREQVVGLVADLAKTAERDASMRLTSPVDGVVQDISVHTLGGVVTPALPIMSVVPSSDSVEVEASILNRDIGFVRPGQDAVVKVDSFPYTKYGFLTAKVVAVAHDAIKDEKLGYIFLARVRLDRSKMNIDGTWVDISPGMDVSVEVKTGKRTVLEYLVEPLQTHLTESLHER